MNIIPKSETDTFSGNDVRSDPVCYKTVNAPKISQVTVIGRPQPKTWDDYERGCLDNYGGGHRSDGHLEAFQHGMSTVFNLLRAEFPPAEVCKSAPMIEQLKAALEKVNNRDHCTSVGVEVERDPHGNPRINYKGYSLVVGCIEEPTLEAVIARLNDATPAKLKLKEAASLRAKATQLESEAAALEKPEAA